MRYSSNIIPLCAECSREENAEKICEHCGISFCKHYASNTDFRYCGNCFNDFKVIERMETKIIEHINDENEVVSRRRFICKSLSLTGSDWLFTAHKINSLSDEELTATIEYHREIASQMLQEREARRIERYHKLSKVRINIPLRNDASNEGTTKANKTTKSSRARSTKQPDAGAIAAAFATIIGSKISPEQIAAAIAAYGSQKKGGE